MICQHGTVKDHKTHDYDLLADVAANHGTKLCDEAEQMAKLQATLEQGIARVKQEETALVEQAQAQKNAVKTHFEQLALVLLERKQQLIREIEAAQARKQNLLTGQREELEHAVASMESGGEHARRTAELGDDFEVMQAYSRIVNGMRGLREKEYQLQPVTRASIKFVDSFTGATGGINDKLAKHGFVFGGVLTQLTLEEPFDCNGVLYYIATGGGERAYANPHEAGLVIALMSSMDHKKVHPRRFVQHPHNGNSCYNYTDNIPGSWMAVDLRRSLRPTHYCLRSDRNSGGYKLRNWRLEGSNDGSSWTTLCEHCNDTSLSGMCCRVRVVVLIVLMDLIVCLCQSSTH